MPNDAATTRLKDLLKRVPPERLYPLFERHGVPADGGTDPLVETICLDGSNDIASLLRGWEGVSYAEVVRDVAQRFEIESSEQEPELELEPRILQKLVQQYYANATPEQRQQIDAILRDLGERHNDIPDRLLRSGLRGGAALLVSQALRPVLVQLIKEVIFRGALAYAGREAAKGAARLAGFAIPLLNVALIGWTVVDLAGPAFRKTVPTVVEVALMRLEFGGSK